MVAVQLDFLGGGAQSAGQAVANGRALGRRRRDLLAEQVDGRNTRPGLRPPDAVIVIVIVIVIVNESTSTMAEQLEWLPTTRPGSFFATASGDIGWAVPAGVGVALADRERGVRRPVVGLIGDGSFRYSVQALYTAARHRLPIVYVVMRNHEYAILKSFARLEDTPGVPGLDLPDLDIASLARG
ncbi:thiamine pyrophosphate-dependent enzyme [Kitasatospora sp. NPDC051984]|uniref:thiamine pyrophosphate-dependent enzyme n=1 Tax=Kitasatospora sp. NPDC051984 TaxID=3364059 RepID=UPI0037C9502C